MSIQEELHNVRNLKTLNDYKELLNKINSIVKEELNTDVVTFLQSMHNLSKTVHSRTLTEWSYRECNITKKFKEVEIEEMYNDLSESDEL